MVVGDGRTITVYECRQFPSAKTDGKVYQFSL
jgi:hypothetical protein